MWQQFQKLFNLTTAQHWMQDTNNRAKTHRQSRRTSWTKRTRSTTDTLQFKEQKVRKQNFMWLICKWIYKTSMLEVMRFIFSLRIVFKITILLSQKWKWLLLIIILWCVLHTGHYTPLESRTFELILWGEMQPLLLNAGTDLKSV